MARRNKTTEGANSPDVGDVPLIELSEASLKKLISRAKKRGYLTYDEIDSSLPELTVDQIQDVISSLSELGITLVGNPRSPAGIDLEKRYSGIRSILLDGSSASRSQLILQLQANQFADPTKLAIWLRSFLTEQLAPERSETAAQWIRDPADIPTIRSWTLSALIWSDCEHPDSREILLRYLDASFESQSGIRFWVLAGLMQRNVTYSKDALRRSFNDPEEVVALLARVASSPENPIFIKELEKSLRSKDFRRAWPALRVLRVVPMPQLALMVAQLLDRKQEQEFWDYDALFALATRPMAEAARDFLLKRPGLLRLAEIVLNQANLSTEVAAKAFGQLLSVFERTAVRQAIDIAAVKLGASRELVREVLSGMETGRPTTGQGELFVAGHASDTIDVTKDDIGIARDVETLAAVIMAREVQPPLAIGLFGAWGSGKSFFMRSIREATARIERRAQQKPGGRFCDNIVQIDFNAWHYSDANLWASLVSHILDELSAHVAPGATAAQQQLSLQTELDSTRTEIANAEVDLKRAKQALGEAQTTLERLRVERERKEVKLRDLRASDLVKLWETQGELKSELVAALNQVGAPAAVQSLRDLNSVVEESYSAGGRAAALLTGILTAQNAGTVAICILLLLGAPLGVWLIVLLFKSEQLAFLSAVTAEIVVFIGAAATFLRKGLRHAKAGLESLAAAKRKVDVLLAQKRATPQKAETNLEHEIARARVGEQEASQRLTAASAQAADIEARVAALEESQSLGYFLVERTRSDDYRRHLGLISVIRKDFETLVSRLQFPPAGAQRRVDRIILYIDDLDRCPSSMVVDVLQAVHLLLAYPLFVVVVSVDPRWLLKSLESRYRHFKRDEKSGGEWAATPQDYLEKIFQIPFSVRPMGEDGFSRLMDRLLAPVEGLAEEGRRTGGGMAEADGSTDSTAADARIGGAHDVQATKSKRLKSKASPPPLVAGTPETNNQSIDILEDALLIQPVELSFASRLHAFIPTPRSAKRFANIYRLLKAPVSRNEIAQHEGTAKMPGEFQLPMLLLALLVGHPAEAASLFPEFLARAREGRYDFWSASDADQDETPAIASIRKEIADIASEATFPNSPQLVIDWLPKVARFSFGTARIATEES